MNNKEISNLLMYETSPYLLQHANNPVHWYPWGQAAFDAAKKENKPIFLSIGYSTCHWCHVMAHECFEDDEVAALLNENFIAIKVDKEERPDVDSVYMMVCQMLTGQGGWPLTIFMTPDQKPFFAGTYFPKYSRYGSPGLIELLNSITELWNQNREKLLSSSAGIARALQQQYSITTNSGKISKKIAQKGYHLLAEKFDAQNGGFSLRPKFPTPHHLMFLLRYHTLNNDPFALEMVEQTLIPMYRGGIFDHIGGGFSRYSTDDIWLVPHFEKMLYDNALLIIAYLETYQVTRNSFYREIAIRTIAYVQTELQSPAGGFYSAQDADSDGVEGKYYVFTPEEIQSVLGIEDAAIFCQRFGITTDGNFEGGNIPNLRNNPYYDIEEDKIKEMRKKLYDYRCNRTSLHKDDKILTSWNSLMMVALAKAYQILGEASYLEAAIEAYTFIETHLRSKEGLLYASYRDGKVSGEGHLDDYAYYIWALIELYAATYAPIYLEKALFYEEEMVRHFQDREHGGFFLGREDGEQLICRPKEFYDGAMPSGNSVAAYDLLRLAKLTGDTKLDLLAQEQLEAFASAAEEYPAAYSFYLIAVLFATYPAKDLVCVLGENSSPEKLRSILSSKFSPNLSVLVKTTENAAQLKKAAPFTESHSPKYGEDTYYVCENSACGTPLFDVEKLADQL